MALSIGDNFNYLGKKFLDARQSFDTLEAMNSCNDVPEGFITYCKEDGNRYEYKDGVWKEYVVTSSGDSNISVDDVIHYGTDEPTNDNVIWFFPDTYSQEITIDNPLIIELISTIQAMQEQINRLEKDVEYLKIHGGGGGTVDPTPNPNPTPTPTTYSYLVLEDGSKLLLETGESILLEEQEATSVTYSYLVLEDGSKLLLETGESILLEEQEATPTTYSYMTLEDGSKLLLETGESILLEEQKTTVISSNNVLLENGSKVLLENGEKMLLEA